MNFPLRYLKYITAIIGYWLFGFFGAILGFIVGSAFTAVRMVNGGTLFQSQQQKTLQQEAFVKTVFTLMGALAKADSRVSEAEIAQAETTIESMRFDSESRDQAIAYFKNGSSPDFDLEGTLSYFMEVSGKSAQLKYITVVYLIGIAFADSSIHPAEDKLMRTIASRLGYSEQAYEMLLNMVLGQSQFSRRGQSSQGQNYNQHRHSNSNRQAPPSSAIELASAYQALGVKAEDSDAVIKKAFRKLISEYHPDKLIGQGVPEDMVAVATQRTQEVQRAYQVIQDSRKR